MSRRETQPAAPRTAPCRRRRQAAAARPVGRSTLEWAGRGAASTCLLRALPAPQVGQHGAGLTSGAQLGLPAVHTQRRPPQRTLPVRAEYTAPAGAHRSATLRAVMVNRYHLPAHQHFTPSANRRPLDSEPIDRRRYSRGVSHASAGLAGTFVSTAPGQLLPLIIVLLVSVYLSVTIKTAISVSPLVQRAALRASAGMTGQGRGVCKVSFPRRRQLWSGGGQILARSDQCVY